MAARRRGTVSTPAAGRSEPGCPRAPFPQGESLSWRPRVEAPIDPTGTPPAPVRKSALGFFAATLVLHALPGAALQSLQPGLGLAWSEVFAFLLPAAAAAAGGNLKAGRFLLLSRRPTAAQMALGLACGATGFVAATGLM